MAGNRTGLRYSVVITLMKERGMKRKRRVKLLEDIRVIENAALVRWAEVAKDG